MQQETVTRDAAGLDVQVRCGLEQISDSIQKDSTSDDIIVIQGSTMVVITIDSPNA